MRIKDDVIQIHFKDLNVIVQQLILNIYNVETLYDLPLDISVFPIAEIEHKRNNLKVVQIPRQFKS